ncbi:MAG: hypothetical protein LUB59_05450 [Candidatus Gastranaerophilales bacterium]|nr:hypothetical protein [Candidatus Gastranaerophilales bacterium]
MQQRIDEENARIAEKDAYVHDVLGNNLKTADNEQETAHQTYKQYTSIYNNSTFEQKHYEQTLKELQEEMQAAINQAVAQAEQEGKTPEEINNIKNNIQQQYGDKILSARYNIGQATKSNKLSQTSFLDAQSMYREAKFGKISASNEYISGLFSLSNDYHDLGKSQQFQSFLEAQIDTQGNKNWTV